MNSSNLILCICAFATLNVVSAVLVPVRQCAMADWDPYTFLVKNVSATSWPPMPERLIVLNMTGQTSAPITDGILSMLVLVDGAALYTATFPLDMVLPSPCAANSSCQLSLSVSAPLQFPTSGVLDVHLFATDNSGQPIICFTIANDTTYAQSQQRPIEVALDDSSSIFTSMQSVTADLNALPVTIPFEQCPDEAWETYALPITSASADNWPPKRGVQFNVNISGVTVSPITNGYMSVLFISNRQVFISDILDLTFALPSGCKANAECSYQFGGTLPTGSPTGPTVWYTFTGTYDSQTGYMPFSCWTHHFQLNDEQPTHASSL